MPSGWPLVQELPRPAARRGVAARSVDLRCCSDLFHQFSSLVSMPFFALFLSLFVGEVAWYLCDACGDRLATAYTPGFWRQNKKEHGFFNEQKGNTVSVNGRNGR